MPAGRRRLPTISRIDPRRPRPAMPRFRSAPGSPSRPALPEGLTAEVVRQVAADVIRPAHFFASGNLELEWEHAEEEEVSWEVFRGRLLDPAQTRQRRRF